MPDLKELEGVLLVDKPVGHTSHDVVARLRKLLQMKRIGHAGTLDPMATGLLIVLIGKATKLSQYLMSLDKEYEGTIRLGVVTDSHDSEGEVLLQSPVPELSLSQIREHMVAFKGDQYQTPPMFSAIKKEGVPLYKLARKGQEIAREPRFIRISRFDLLRYEAPDIDFSLHCTKGTYVRTLAHDLGNAIGCGAHLCRLRRTASDQFRVEQARPLETFLEEGPSSVANALIPSHRAAPLSII